MSAPRSKKEKAALYGLRRAHGQSGQVGEDEAYKPLTGVLFVADLPEHKQKDGPLANASPAAWVAAWPHSVALNAQEREKQIQIAADLVERGVSAEEALQHAEAQVLRARDTALLRKLATVRH